MITKFDKFNLIKECPDIIKNYAEDINLEWSDEEAIPFFVDVNADHTIVEKVYVGGYKKMHSSISGLGENKAYAGRLWDESKVMSFWVYPTVNLFKQIINLLEEKLDTKIFDNDWKIEVITNSDSGNIERSEYDPNLEDDDDDAFFQGIFIEGVTKIIPIEDYVGSKDQPEELRIQHLLNWQEKEKLKKERGVKGFGSAKTAWDKPKNIKYRQTIYQENKKH